MAMKVLLAVSVHVAAATQQRNSALASANPIRKVVTMLQSMQKKVEVEAAKAEEMFEKYQCYCKTSGGDLSDSIAAAEAKAPQLAASIEAAEGKLAQLKTDVKSHQTDREAAKTAMAEATSIRKKEKATYDKTYADSKTNLAAVRKAVAALERGAAGGFVQTSAASVLRSIVKSSDRMPEADREDVLSFLAGGSGYAPASGEVTGILKQMGDEMDKDLKELVATEKTAVSSYEGLMDSKKKEVAALSQSIEDKLARIAETGVSIESMKNDLEDTTQSLSEDKKFLAGLEENCKSKAAVFEEEKKMRGQEVVALADTIQLLNSDDALELFKKTLPSASASFLQVEVNRASVRREAREIMEMARARAPAGVRRESLDFISLALRGRKVGFEKVTKLIDELVQSLKADQADDDKMKEYCGEQFDLTEDKTKELHRSLSDAETVIEETKEGIATAADEISKLKASIKALDTSVAAATEQRKEENSAHKDLMASNGAAKELILFAKNRLQKFYNPRMFKAPPKAELSAEDRIVENMAFVQVAVLDAPAPPPETAAAYTKKSEESGGVMAMMDLLVADLTKEMTVSETEEKAAQGQYESLMSESAEKRAQDSKSLTDREASKADLEGALETTKGEKKATAKELMATERYVASLHGECDFLLQYHEVRKQARADEIDSLEKAKAVLAGADFSFVQVSSGISSPRARKFLRGV